MKRFHNILLVADAKETSHNAVQAAKELARSNSAALTVLVIADELPSYLKRFAPPSLLQSNESAIEEFTAALKATFSEDPAVSVKRATGKPFVAVVKEVLQNQRDLVIKSVTPGRGGRINLLGATDMHLLRKCPCPVWLIKEGADFKIDTVMAAVDFNEIDQDSGKEEEPLNRDILKLAHSLSQRQGARLHVVHAWEAIGEDLMKSNRVQATDAELEEYLSANREMHAAWLESLLEKAQSWMTDEGFSRAGVTTHLPKGPAEDHLPEVAKQIDADVIVMGTLARTGISGVLMGNTAETVLQAIDCSVLAIKPEGFKSPIEVAEG